jgi:hypothetical protein
MLRGGGGCTFNCCFICGKINISVYHVQPGISVLSYFSTLCSAWEFPFCFLGMEASHAVYWSFEKTFYFTLFLPDIWLWELLHHFNVDCWSFVVCGYIYFYSAIRVCIFTRFVIIALKLVRCALCNILLVRYVLAADITWIGSITTAGLIVFQHMLARRASRCIRVTSANTVGVGTSTAVDWPVIFRSATLLPRSSPVLSVRLLSPGRNIWWSIGTYFTEMFPIT